MERQFHHNTYLKAIRINAGAVHSYVMMANGSTNICPSYPPRSGCIPRDGLAKIATIGRLKIEKTLLKVSLKSENITGNVILQRQRLYDEDIFWNRYLSDRAKFRDEITVLNEKGMPYWHIVQGEVTENDNSRIRHANGAVSILHALGIGKGCSTPVKLRTLGNIHDEPRTVLGDEHDLLPCFFDMEKMDFPCPRYSVGRRQ